MGQIITNQSFENWAIDSTGYLNPIDWFTENGYETTAATVIQAPGRTGNYCAKLVSAYNGTEYVGGSLFFFYAGNLRPLILSGYWKGTYSNNEALIAGVTTVNSTFDAIGYGLIYDSISDPDWVEFHDTVEFLYPGVAIQTYVQIILDSYSANAVGYVDDLVLTYTTDIGEIKNVNLLSSSLSHDSQSGNYTLNFDLLKSCPIEISLYSAEGKNISTASCRFGSGHHEVPVFAPELSQGIYFCRIIGESVNKTYKLAK